MRGLGFVLVAACFIVAGSAQAGAPLTTAPISSTFGDSDTLFCQAANVGKKAVTVLFEAVNVNGQVVGSIEHTLEPGAVNGLQEVETAQYCRFTGGSAKTLRAHAVYYDSGNSDYLLSVEAH